MRQRAGERSDREIGRGGAVGDGFDNARRHEGEWNEPPDVALDLVLTSGNRLELSSPVRDIARCRSVKSLVQLRVAGWARETSRDLAIYISAHGWSPIWDPRLFLPRKDLMGVVWGGPGLGAGSPQKFYRFSQLVSWSPVSGVKRTSPRRAAASVFDRCCRKSAGRRSRTLIPGGGISGRFGDDGATGSGSRAFVL